MLTVKAWEVVTMSNPSRQFAQPHSSHAQVALAFERDEWELVVTLPRRVLLAAVAAAPADGRRAAEGIAGIEAIASGLASRSALVREIVAAIYAESHQDHDEPATDADVITVRTLAACRYAAQVVADRCGADDAASYREWLLHIAAVVSGVAQGVSAPAQARGPTMSRFLYALEGVLRP
jgi:hypothetical protein